MPPATINDLGDGVADGQVAQLVVADELVRLRWWAAAGEWRSAVEPHIGVQGDWPQNVPGGPGLQYLYSPIGNPGQIGQSSFGFKPYPIRNPAAHYAAGLVLYERVSMLAWAYDTPNRFDLCIVIYDMVDGDQISGAIVPADHLSMAVPLTQGVRHFVDTGFVASPLTPAPGSTIWAPHLYGRYLDGPTQTTLEFSAIERRWIGTP